LTADEVKKNMKTYVEQAKKILGDVGFEVKYNSKWLAKMNLEDVIGLTSKATVQQMLKRDMFKARWGVGLCSFVNNAEFSVPMGTLETLSGGEERQGAEAEVNVVFFNCPKCGRIVNLESLKSKEHTIKRLPRPIYLQEFLYPLMQGYDSVAMKVDGEVGGNDQTFNMLVGRDLEKSFLGKEKLVFATKLLVDTSTGKKISKSEGGMIAVNDSPEDVFGKTMHSVPDEMIKTVFELATEKDQAWIDGAHDNPKVFKEDLAYELVRMYHGEKAAEKAKGNFERVFSQGQVPEEMEEIKSTGTVISSILAAGIVTSSSEGKRLIEQGAVKINGQVVSRWDQRDKPGDILQVGPHRFFKEK
jgi:tyrosyl-tRNA synthetase